MSVVKQVKQAVYIAGLFAVYAVVSTSMALVGVVPEEAETLENM